MNFEYNELPLFATPVVSMNFNHIEESTITNIKNLQYERNFKDNGWFTKEKNILNKNIFADLRKNILEYFNFYKSNIIQTTEDFDICASWAIKHEKSDHAPRHKHYNSIFSGVLYLQTDNNSGELIFHDEKSLGLNVEFDMKYSNYNIYNSSVWKIIPKNNLIIFFPSSLSHSVSNSNSDNERIVVAFNFFMKKFLSEELSSYLNINLI